MEDGTEADYALLTRLEEDFAAGLPDRLLAQLRGLADGLSGYKIDRLQHSLQSATRARRDGADDDWVVAALLHDVGDAIAPYNHDSIAADILAPYVRAEVTWVVRHHGIFQLAYYGDKVGEDPEARAKFADSPHYQKAVIFCERWDQTAFDPDYPTDSLESFEPLVRAVFARKAWSPDVLQEGVAHPLVSA
jgi:predicted HD phosphohydrolase